MGDFELFCFCRKKREDVTPEERNRWITGEPAVGGTCNHQLPQRTSELQEVDFRVTGFESGEAGGLLETCPASTQLQFGRKRGACCMSGHFQFSDLPVDSFESL